MKLPTLVLAITCLLSALLPKTAHAWGSPRPRTSYKEYKIEGFNVRVLTSIQSNPLVKTTLDRLLVRLKEVKKLSPRRLGTLAGRVTIWLTNSNNSASMVYHPSSQWLAQNSQNTDFARGIEIANLKNYLDWNVVGDQPMMVLHELAHAYHDQILSFGNRTVTNAFTSARESRSYESVSYRNNAGPKLRAYALNDEREYFAEISEAYFGVNDYYPFVRSELQAFDPLGYNLMVSIWGM